MANDLSSTLNYDVRADLLRGSCAMSKHPALVLNADYRPLSYYPLSLWTWQDAVKAAWLDRVDIVAEYDGDATRLWTEAKTGEALFARVKALPGFGEQKAAVGASIRRTGYTLPVNANMTVGRGRAQPEK